MTNAVDPRCICVARTAGRYYPVMRPEEDDRFSTAVVNEVAEVLTANGFPLIEDDSPDWYALLWVLTRYVYGLPGEPAGQGTEAEETPHGGAEW